jgi:NitT/TauT family transport system substrate-binding protein
MHITRRQTLNIMAAGLVSSILLPASSVLKAQEKRSLHFELVGYTLGIHVPAVMAVRDTLLQAGYAASQVDRIESMEVIAKSVIAGSTEIGDTDVVSALRSTQAGAQACLVGLVYNSTDQVLLVNADKIKSYEDFKKPSNSIALNAVGDFIYVMVSGALARHNVDIDDVTIVEIGGSGSRLKALLAGRVAAVPVHFDQAASVMKQGNFKVLVKPWKEYPHWFSEGWFVSRKWLDNKDNQRAVVDLNKAVIASFRKANTDFKYFADGYRKYATTHGHANVTDEVLHPAWKELVTEIKAWPSDGGFKREYFKELLPTYRRAHALKKGKVDLDTAIEPKYVEQALKELG